MVSLSAALQVVTCNVLSTFARTVSDHCSTDKFEDFVQLKSLLKVTKVIEIVGRKAQQTKHRVYDYIFVSGRVRRVNDLAMISYQPH